MARWNETEFVERATRIAHDHAVLSTPVNDLAEKVARDENLQPDEIRTLVRLANVQTFQQLFKRKDDGDKMVAFETGDPEAVIQRIVSSAQSAPQSANISNDKLASWDAPDMMREVRFGQKFDQPQTVKVADDLTEEPVKGVRRDLSILALRKLAGDFEIERIGAGQRWEDSVKKLAHEFRKAHVKQAHVDFEKDAFSEHGMDIWPELAGVRDSLKLPLEAPVQEKVAELQQRHVTTDTPLLGQLKIAREARRDYEHFKLGLEWIEKNQPSLEG